MTGNITDSFEPASRQGKPETHPAADKSSFTQLCGDIDMRIARDGTWYYLGSPIGRQNLVKLFASVLQRDETGDFWLVTPAEMCRIQVEDAPFTAVEMTAEGSGQKQVLKFRTNLDENVTVDADHPIHVDIAPETGEPSPYVLVRDRLLALISRSVFYELVELGVSVERAEGECLGVWSSGRFFEIGALTDA